MLSPPPTFHHLLAHIQCGLPHIDSRLTINIQIPALILTGLTTL
jgi:hypothetical protein